MNILKEKNRFPDFKKSVLLDAAKNLGLQVVFDEGRFTTFSDGKKECSFIGVAPETTSLFYGIITINKHVSNILFQKWGVPVLPHVFTDSVTEITSFLKRHTEIIIKPLDGSFSRGLTMHITDTEVIKDAVAYAAENSKKKRTEVLVQKQALGDDHRLLVVGQREVYVLRKNTPKLIGDGVSTIQTLFTRENDSRKSLYGEKKVIIWDTNVDKILQRRGVDNEYVLKGGEVLLLDTITDFDKKRLSENITESVCKKAVDIAIKIAQHTKMDVIGIDILSEDITDDSKDMYVIEVNNSPGIRWHVQPAIGESIHVGEKILQYFFGENHKAEE